MTDIKSVETKKLNVKWGLNRFIQQEKFTSKNGVTREQIRRKAQAMSNLLASNAVAGVVKSAQP